MGLKYTLKNWYTRPGPGIPENAPRKKGLFLFFDILLRELFELMKLNLLFLLFCIPIVTIPAAITAMTGVTLKMVRDENHFLWQDFLGTFKAEFKEATLGGWVLIILLGLSGVGIYVYARMIPTQSLFIVPLVLTLILSFILLFSSFYFFPMLALVKLPFGQKVKNSVLLGCVCFGPNLAAALIFLAVAACVYLFFLVTVPLLLFIVFALLNFICTFAAYGGLRKYVLAKECEEK